VVLYATAVQASPIKATTAVEPGEQTGPVVAVVRVPQGQMAPLIKQAQAGLVLLLPLLDRVSHEAAVVAAALMTPEARQVPEEAAGVEQVAPPRARDL
jgi:hypothetical protein